MAEDDEDSRPEGTPAALWAPWRMEYLKGPRPDGCPLCHALDKDRLVVHRGRRAFVIMNLYPYSNGHVMVAPIEHLSNLDDVDDDTGAEILHLTRRAIAALRSSERPEGFNVGYNLGRAAGAGIDDHIHQHIVPRWIGDTNFMPVLGGAKVIGEAIEATLARLKQAF
ncbi:MAG TPA: HIT domain-containing protein [Candidatus Dormibacteraeota bacterium]